MRPLFVLSSDPLTMLTVTAKGDDLFGEQLLGSSDWPDFEGDAAFTVPPKPMAELYASQGDQVWDTQLAQ